MEHLRMCAVCRKLISKSELIRFVRVGSEIEIDPSGKKDGRGAYICKNDECLKKAIKTNALSKSFKQPVDKDIIAKYLENYVAESKN